MRHHNHTGGGTADLLRVLVESRKGLSQGQGHCWDEGLDISWTAANSTCKPFAGLRRVGGSGLRPRALAG